MKDSLSLEKQFDLEVNDVWKEFVWITQDPPYKIVKCVSLFVPTDKIEGYSTVSTWIKSRMPTFHLLLKSIIKTLKINHVFGCLYLKTQIHQIHYRTRAIITRSWFETAVINKYLYNKKVEWTWLASISIKLR